METVQIEGRIVWPHLRSVDKFGNFSASFVLEKTDPKAKQIKKIIDGLVKNELKGKKPNSPGKMKIQPANNKLGDEYSDYILIGACTSQDEVRLINQKKQEMDTDPAGGSHVRALLAFSSYNNEYGPGIMVFVNGVQFIAKGDPLGTARPTDKQIDDQFDEIDVPDDEVAEAGEEKSVEEDFFA